MRLIVAGIQVAPGNLLDSPEIHDVLSLSFTHSRSNTDVISKYTYILL